MVQFASKLLSIVLASCIWGVVTNAQDTSLITFDEIITADADLTALNTALGASGFNLSAAFDTSVTLFAPNNDAFSAYSELIAQYADSQYVAHLQNLLLQHVVESEVLSTDLEDGQVATAANGEDITVTLVATVTLSTAYSNATVVATDILSSDGVIHQINGLLLPSFSDTTLIDLTTDVDGFDIVLELLQFTGLAALVGPDLTATIFAPTDTAFEALPDGALEYYRTNKGIATLLLSGHVISPLIVPTQNMINGSAYVTPIRTNLTISFSEVEGIMLYKVNNATIISPNTLASNGIIHAIGKVLEVSGTEYPPQTIITPTPTLPFPTTSPTATPTTFPPVFDPSPTIQPSIMTTKQITTTMPFSNMTTNDGDVNTPINANSSANTDSSSSNPFIIGLAIGCVGGLVLAVLIALLILIIQRRHPRKAKNQFNDSNADHDDMTWPRSYRTTVPGNNTIAPLVHPISATTPIISQHSANTPSNHHPHHVAILEANKRTNLSPPPSTPSYPLNPLLNVKDQCRDVMTPAVATAAAS